MRRPRHLFLTLFNPPGALYLFDSEDAFYNGELPIFAEKSSALFVGAIVQHVDRYELLLVG